VAGTGLEFELAPEEAPGADARPTVTSTRVGATALEPTPEEPLGFPMEATPVLVSEPLVCSMSVFVDGSRKAPDPLPLLAIFKGTWRPGNISRAAAYAPPVDRGRVIELGIRGSASNEPGVAKYVCP
jgi:hypothetical protein